MTRQDISNILFYPLSAFIMTCYILPQMQAIVDTVSLAFITLIFAIIFIFGPNGKPAANILTTAIPYIALMFVIAVPFQFIRGLLYPTYLFWNSIFPAILCIEILRRQDYKWALFLLISSFIVFGFVLSNTTEVMNENDNIMRTMTATETGGEFYQEMKLKGVGGYGTAYSAGMLTVFFVSLALYGIVNKARNILVFLLLGGAIIFAWFSYKAQFTTLIIITALSIIVSMWFFKKSVIWRFFFIICGIAIIYILPDIILLMIQDNTDNAVGMHLRDLYAENWGGGASTEDVRALYREICFDEFLNSPVWGQNTTGRLHWIYTHSHSSLLSILLATGIIGLFFYYKSLYKAYKYLIIWFSDKCKRTIFLPIIIYFMLLSYYNSSMAIELYWCMFLIIPLTAFVFVKQSRADLHRSN